MSENRHAVGGFTRSRSAIENPVLAVLTTALLTAFELAVVGMLLTVGAFAALTLIVLFVPTAIRCVLRTSG